MDKKRERMAILVLERVDGLADAGGESHGSRKVSVNADGDRLCRVLERLVRDRRVLSGRQELGDLRNETSVSRSGQDGARERNTHLCNYVLFAGGLVVGTIRRSERSVVGLR